LQALARKANAEGRLVTIFDVGEFKYIDDVEALALLEPLLADGVDFVRQGACMGMALVLQQTSEARSPFVKKFRDHLRTTIADKHQPTVTKSGAILAAGMLDAGGRNVVVSMQSRAGFVKMGGAVCMAMFLQHWYW
jgi:26S proteasome regulatory subunit N2